MTVNSGNSILCWGHMPKLCLIASKCDAISYPAILAVPLVLEYIPKKFHKIDYLWNDSKA